MDACHFRFFDGTDEMESGMNYEDFLRRLSKSARSALAHAGIDDFNKLASLSQEELL